MLRRLRLHVTAAAIAVSIGLLGCSSSSRVSVGVSTVPPISAVPTQPPPTTANPLGHVYTGSVKFGDTGDLTNFRLEIGTLRPASELTGDNIGAVCSMDRQRDMVAPYQVNVENGNDGFSQKPDFEMFAAYSSSAPPIQIATNYSDGPKCSEVTNYDGFGSSTAYGCTAAAPLDPHQSITCEGLIILKGALSPNAPQGDIGAISGAYLWIDDVASVSRGTRQLLTLSANLQQVPGAFDGVMGFSMAALLP